MKAIIEKQKEYLNHVKKYHHCASCIAYENELSAFEAEEKDNDDWIKIESNKDYPTKECRYWIANKNGIFDFFADKEQIIRKYENGTLTHYKELKEISPPIN